MVQNIENEKVMRDNVAQWVEAVWFKGTLPQSQIPGPALETNLDYCNCSLFGYNFVISSFIC